MLKSVASPVELQIVIAGEIDKTTGRVTVTDGELKERTFDNIASVIEEMKKAGYRRGAVDQLRTILESNVEALKKMDGGTGFGKALKDTGPDNMAAQEAAGGKISLVVVERINEEKFGFRVSVGSAHEAGGQYDLDRCEKMNKRCFYCPDGKIRCKAPAVTK
jgi:hypothetical protein